MTPDVPPVEDWATDYDLFDERYVSEPGPIWADLRERCPVAHTERWGGSWMPTRYDDVHQLAKMVPALSSAEVLVVKPPPFFDEETGETIYGVEAPPITSDPPAHGPARRLILPAFSPQRIAQYEPYTVSLANALIDRFVDEGRCDGAADYAQQIPPRLIARILGIDEQQADTFADWARGVLELNAPEVRNHYRKLIRDFFFQQVRDRRENPRDDDFISDLLSQEFDGQGVTDVHAVVTCNLLLVAGIDTTWSSIGSGLFHLATHPEDRRRLVAEPELLPTAVEELLRVYAPVTMARLVTEETKVDGVTFEAGDRVLLNFPAANRDPRAFPDPDRVVIDRRDNRHIAFGVGIHRCAGSNLARMEMVEALGTFLARIPEFELEDPGAVRWGGGQVRGPRALPLVF